MGHLSHLERLTQEMVAAIAALPDKDAQIEALNTVRQHLHEVSPMRHEPIDLVLWVPHTTVYANDYNPNVVAPPEMKLLTTSISHDGYTQPIVTMPTEEGREVIDGFHRSKVGSTDKQVQERVLGYLPVTTIRASQESKDNRMAATIRHNRARGTHQVSNMSEIVVELARRNWSDAKIAKELGMDADEVLRLKQISGLAELFADTEFSQAWEVRWEND